VDGTNVVFCDGHQQCPRCDGHQHPGPMFTNFNTLAIGLPGLYGVYVYDNVKLVKSVAVTRRWPLTMPTPQARNIFLTVSAPGCSPTTRIHRAISLALTAAQVIGPTNGT